MNGNKGRNSSVKRMQTAEKLEELLGSASHSGGPDVHHEDVIPHTWRNVSNQNQRYHQIPGKAQKK